MSTARSAIFFAIGVVIVLFMTDVSSGDIYRYRDKDGIWHFTNIKSDKRYKLYIRTSFKRPADYIKAYSTIIKEASRRFGIESSLIKAVIKAESDFDHKAVSRKGARGLMQLMPKTMDRMDVKDPFNPEENIFGGTRYLSLLLERFDNDKKLALAAYNAGPEIVEEYQGVPPFPETKSFISKVLNYYYQYRSESK
jgi:soluble lytic murein transglycosylase-like protein